MPWFGKIEGHGTMVFRSASHERRVARVSGAGRREFARELNGIPETTEKKATA